MENFFRKLLLILCDLIYGIVPDLYDMFFSLSSAEIFSSEDIQQISSNLYVLISLVMLFAFAIKVIEAIVNPDLLLDKKKGVAGVFKRAIIGLGLIVATPFAFGQLYKIQNAFLSSNFFEKIIVGVSLDNAQSNNNQTCESESSQAGQVLAGTALYVFLYPRGLFNTNGSYSVTAENIEAANKYKNIITCDIKDLSEMSAVINEKNNGKYVYNFNGVCALGLGIFLVYQLILLCMDTALRLVKLSFLQLIAPVIILAYIFTNDDTLMKYLKEVGSTFAQVFARIAAFAFYILVLSKIPDAVSRLSSANSKIWTIVFVMIGALQFVKIVPDLIGKLLGIQIQRRGGIKGRLGEMAGVGGLAQKAWSGLQGLGGLGAGIVAGTLGKGIGYLPKKVMKKLDDTEKGHKILGRTSQVGSALKGAWTSGGFLKGATGAKKALDENLYSKELAKNRENKKIEGIATSGNVDPYANRLKQLYKVDENGNLILDENGNPVTVAPTANDIELLKENTTEHLMKDKNIPGAIKRAMLDLDNSKETQVQIKILSDATDEIKSTISTARSLDPEKAGALGNAWNSYKDSLNSEKLLSALKNANLNEADYKNIENLLENINGVKNNSKFAKALSAEGITLDKLGSITLASNTFEGIVNNKQSRLDFLESNTKNLQKSLVDEYIRSLDVLNKEYATAIKKGTSAFPDETPIPQRPEAFQQQFPNSENYQQQPYSSTAPVQPQNQGAQSQPMNNAVDTGSALDLLSDIQSYRDQISSIDAKMKAIENQDYNFAYNPEYIDLNAQKQAAEYNIEHYGESPYTVEKGEFVQQAPSSSSSSNSQYNQGQETFSNSQTANTGTNSTDNSDIISALDRINASVTNNTNSIGDAIDTAATKISDTTKTSMEANADAIIESDNETFRKTMNFERSRHDDDPDNDQFQNE